MRSPGGGWCLVEGVEGGADVVGRDATLHELHAHRRLQQMQLALLPHAREVVADGGERHRKEDNPPKHHASSKDLPLPRARCDVAVADRGHSVHAHTAASKRLDPHPHAPPCAASEFSPPHTPPHNPP